MPTGLGSTCCAGMAERTRFNGLLPERFGFLGSGGLVKRDEHKTGDPKNTMAVAQQLLC